MDKSAFRSCRICAADFEPKAYQIAKADYECSACKRSRQNAKNATRDLSAYAKARYARPEVRSAIKSYHTAKKIDPVYRLKRAARRKVATEIEAGRLIREPCEVCGNSKSDAHHHDYSQPLAVRWLCRRDHFREEHRADSQSIRD